MCKFARLCKHVSAQTRVYTSSELNTHTFRIVYEELIVVWDLSFSHQSFSCLDVTWYFCINISRRFECTYFLHPQGEAVYEDPSTDPVIQPYDSQTFSARTPNLKWTRSTAVGQGINLQEMRICKHVNKEPTQIWFYISGILPWAIVMFLCCWNKILASTDFKVIFRWE